MSLPYIGEIRIFAGNYAPSGWEFCHGQELSITQHDNLFNVIGITYGGNGTTTFRLPDLRGRLPVHQGNGFILGEEGGSETVTLTANEVPAHTHFVQASTAPASTNLPEGNLLASPPDVDMYRVNGPNVPMAPTAVSPVGNNEAHSNLQPFLCLNFIISLYGIFPSPT